MGKWGEREGERERREGEEAGEAGRGREGISRTVVSRVQTLAALTKPGGGTTTLGGGTPDTGCGTPFRLTLTTDTQPTPPSCLQHQRFPKSSHADRHVSILTRHNGMMVNGTGGVWGKECDPRWELGTRQLWTCVDIALTMEPESTLPHHLSTARRHSIKLYGETGSMLG